MVRPKKCELIYMVTTTYRNAFCGIFAWCITYGVALSEVCVGKTESYLAFFNDLWAEAIYVSKGCPNNLSTFDHNTSTLITNKVTDGKINNQLSFITNV